MGVQLNFESLYRQALIDWPEEIDLRTFQYSSSDLSRYTVKGLGTLADEIEERYIGNDAEVIYRDLHISIYTVVLAAAKNILEIKCPL